MATPFVLYKYANYCGRQSRSFAYGQFNKEMAQSQQKKKRGQATF